MLCLPLSLVIVLIFFTYYLRHTLNPTSLFTFLPYLIHPVSFKALIPVYTFAVLLSLTFTLVFSVAVRSAFFRFSLTMTLNLQRCSVTQLCHFHLLVLTENKRKIMRVWYGPEFLKQ